MPRWIRPALAGVAVTHTAIGAWAAVAPRSFYAHLFPGLGGDWVSALGPYDEHLVRDFGEALLAIAVLLWIAAARPERRLVQAALVVALVQAVPHFAFHLTTTGSLGVLANVTSLLSLAGLVAVPAAALAAVSRRRA